MIIFFFGAKYSFVTVTSFHMFIIWSLSTFIVYFDFGIFIVTSANHSCWQVRSDVPHNKNPLGLLLPRPLLYYWWQTFIIFTQAFHRYIWQMITKLDNLRLRTVYSVEGCCLKWVCFKLILQKAVRKISDVVTWKLLSVLRWFITWQIGLIKRILWLASYGP